MDIVITPSENKEYNYRAFLYGDVTIYGEGRSVAEAVGTLIISLSLAIGNGISVTIRGE